MVIPVGGDGTGIALAWLRRLLPPLAILPLLLAPPSNVSAPAATAAASTRSMFLTHTAGAGLWLNAYVTATDPRFTSSSVKLCVRIPDSSTKADGVASTMFSRAACKSMAPEPTLRGISMPHAGFASGIGRAVICSDARRLAGVMRGSPGDSEASMELATGIALESPCAGNPTFPIPVEVPLAVSEVLLGDGAVALPMKGPGL